MIERDVTIRVTPEIEEWAEDIVADTRGNRLRFPGWELAHQIIDSRPVRPLAVGDVIDRWCLVATAGTWTRMRTGPFTVESIGADWVVFRSEGGGLSFYSRSVAQTWLYLRVGEDTPAPWPWEGSDA